MLFQLFVVAALLATPMSARAQITWDGCVDISGAPVASVPDSTINDVAVARREGGHPVIRYNPQVLASISNTSRLFWYLHECGHHVLGHGFQYVGLQHERDADCWAAVKLKELKQLTTNRLNTLAAEFAPNPGDWSHLPGPMRTMDIVNCAALAGRGKVTDDSPLIRASRRIPCSHHVPCSHIDACMHVTQQCGCQHPFDYAGYGTMPCQHCGCVPTRMHPGHPRHQSDTLHLYDEE
jgi:hypothetical protein